MQPLRAMSYMSCKGAIMELAGRVIGWHWGASFICMHTEGCRGWQRLKHGVAVLCEAQLLGRLSI